MISTHGPTHNARILDWLTDLVPSSLATTVAMLGPEAMGDTKTWLGILRILHVLKAMLVWGHEKFCKMFKEGVIDYLEPK